MLVAMVLAVSCNRTSSTLPAGWPDRSIKPPARAFNISAVSRPNDEGPGGRQMDVYALRFDMPGDSSDWSSTKQDLESALRRKHYYIMDTQTSSDYNIAFYTSKDGQHTVILTMFIEPAEVRQNPAQHTPNYVIEVQVNKQGRTPESSWRPL